MPMNSINPGECSDATYCKTVEGGQLRRTVPTAATVQAGSGFRSLLRRMGCFYFGFWVFLAALLFPHYLAPAAPAPAGLSPFNFPTANHALLKKGDEEKFFAGTPGQS